MLKIVPVFEKMFQEFELELPQSTILVIQIANYMVNYGWIGLFAAAFVVSLTLATFFILTIMGTLDQVQDSLQGDSAVPRRRSRAGFVIRILLSICIFLLGLAVFPCFWLVILAPLGLYYAGFFPRDMPVVWRLFRRYDGALVMRGLAVAVRRGLPLPAAIDAVRLSYPIRHVSALLVARSGPGFGGANWIESLRQAKLISRADAAVLAAAERAGNLPWALEEMADSVIRRQTYRLQVAMHVVFPPAMLAVARTGRAVRDGTLFADCQNDSRPDVGG